MKFWINYWIIWNQFHIKNGIRFQIIRFSVPFMFFHPSFLSLFDCLSFNQSFKNPLILVFFFFPQPRSRATDTKPAVHSLWASLWLPWSPSVWPPWSSCEPVWAISHTGRVNTRIWQPTDPLSDIDWQRFPALGTETITTWARCLKRHGGWAASIN